MIPPPPQCGSHDASQERLYRSSHLECGHPWQQLTYTLCCLLLQGYITARFEELAALLAAQLNASASSQQIDKAVSHVLRITRPQSDVSAAHPGVRFTHSCRYGTIHSLLPSLFHPACTDNTVASCSCNVDCGSNVSCSFNVGHNHLVAAAKLRHLLPLCSDPPQCVSQSTWGAVNCSNMQQNESLHHQQVRQQWARAAFQVAVCYFTGYL